MMRAEEKGDDQRGRKTGRGGRGKNGKVRTGEERREMKGEDTKGGREGEL